MTASDLGSVIAAEHRRVGDLLAALATARHDRFPLAHRLIDELAAHTAAELQVFYPALRDIVPGGIAMADQAQGDHRGMRAALVAVEGSHPGDAEFESALATITGLVDEHAPLEENELVPALAAVIGPASMAELGAVYSQIRDALPSGLQCLPPDAQGPRFRRH